ncbi:jg9384 [Pararge aegeria aegeria]|uniref:Jg9384 protein n=1 Tax=Pararge aegeria aegeria TaxID=348720 RepID=A0A8S4RX94_9NEOP|nr:jg9384 [Pararge aegeria aegeria]
MVTKFIRIGIADKNDNPPYFDKELYEAEVDENEDIQHTVLTVTAKDHDEFFYKIRTYSSTKNNFKRGLLRNLLADVTFMTSFTIPSYLIDT